MAGRPMFVTRKFPPSVGGMETLAASVWRGVSAVRPDAILLAHGGSNRTMPLWLPAAVGRMVIAVVRRRAAVVLCGDVLLYAIVGPLLRLLRVPHATMAMGLDITFDNRAYRALAWRGLRRAPRVLAISEATAAAARAAGVPAPRVVVLRLGVEVPDLGPGDRAGARLALHRRLGLDDAAPVVVTLGRLVPRKGVRWFVDQVLPRLSAGVHYVVAGDGPDAGPVRDAAAARGLSDRVHLLGSVDDDTREIVMRGADLFVQPNISVAGDMEGFGLVTVEAAVRATTVVAADLEGIRDAVVDGVTGVLLPSQDEEAWRRCVGSLLADLAALRDRGTAYRAAAADRYGERRMGEEIVRLLEAEIPESSRAVNPRRRSTGDQSSTRS